MWELVKRKGGWVKNLSPFSISLNNGYITNNMKKIAEILNSSLLKKISDIKNDLGPPTGDPTYFLKISLQ